MTTANVIKKWNVTTNIRHPFIRQEVSTPTRPAISDSVTLDTILYEKLLIPTRHLAHLQLKVPQRHLHPQLRGLLRLLYRPLLLHLQRHLRRQAQELLHPVHRRLPPRRQHPQRHLRRQAQELVSK